MLSSLQTVDYISMKMSITHKEHHQELTIFG